MAAGYATPADARLDVFAALCTQITPAHHYPLASRIDANIPVYDGAVFSEPDRTHDLERELNHALGDGPGVVVISDAFSDLSALDNHTRDLTRLMTQEAQAMGQRGDHFAAAGANTRLWNSVGKAATRAPESFISYYANPVMHRVSEAWLGPGYRITGQVNVVHPGGQAQLPHRDYHLGFMTDEQASRYPLTAHRLSPLMTLQGAVAHTDMPVASGPTQLLPWSHQYELGYLAWRREDFKAWFAEHAVQLPLKRGDQLYFNPALFHAAGTNRTRDTQRMANLLQVSSPFGVPMESLDYPAMARAVYPALAQALRAGRMRADAADRVIRTLADGYAFPTNLDTDPPVDGLAPPTQQDVMRGALRDQLSPEDFMAQLNRQELKRRAG